MGEIIVFGMLMRVLWMRYTVLGEDVPVGGSVASSFLAVNRKVDSIDPDAEKLEDKAARSM